MAININNESQILVLDLQFFPEKAFCRQYTHTPNRLWASEFAYTFINGKALLDMAAANGEPQPPHVHRYFVNSAIRRHGIKNPYENPSYGAEKRATISYKTLDNMHWDGEVLESMNYITDLACVYPDYQFINQPDILNDMLRRLIMTSDHVVLRGQQKHAYLHALLDTPENGSNQLDKIHIIHTRFPKTDHRCVGHAGSRQKRYNYDFNNNPCAITNVVFLYEEFIKEWCLSSIQTSSIINNAISDNNHMDESSNITPIQTRCSNVRKRAISLDTDDNDILNIDDSDNDSIFLEDDLN